MSTKQLRHTTGPFRADQLACGDPYELANGHPVECLPGGGRHSKANLVGGLALGTDPAVTSAGVDTGFAPDEKTLRAPDLAVGNVPDAPGWVRGVPPLAVEYADVGQDEADLKDKIRTLLDAGTLQVWVVRLNGPRRVEVHRPGLPRTLVYPGEWLAAPGVLRNPVPVEALYDPRAAEESALRNLLQRLGYEDLEAVRRGAREEGLAAGREEGHAAGLAAGLEAGELALLLRLLERRIGALADPTRARLAGLDRAGLTRLAESASGFADPADLNAWLDAHARGQGRAGDHDGDPDRR